MRTPRVNPEGQTLGDKLFSPTNRSRNKYRARRSSMRSSSFSSKELTDANAPVMASGGTHHEDMGVKQRAKATSDWHTWPCVRWVRSHAQNYLMSVPAQLYMVVLALLSCAIFVYSTYLKDPEDVASLKSGQPSANSSIIVKCIIVVDQFTNVNFLLDFVLSVVGVDSLSWYLLSPMNGFADLMSGIPISMISIALLDESSGIGQSAAMLRTLKFLKVTRVSRLTRLSRLRRESNGVGGGSGNEEVKAEILNAAVILFMLVFVTVDIILILEDQRDQWYIGCDDERVNCGKRLRWHDALYFTVVTLTTVGYGDIGPSNNESRMFIMVVILVSFTSVGRLLGRITAAIARSSPWRTWYVPQKKQPHIIMAGAPEGYYLKFFAEFFSETQRQAYEPTPVICVLSPGDPSEAMKLLVGQLYPALQYIDGSVLRQHDLERAHAETAQAIMVRVSGRDNSGHGEDNSGARTMGNGDDNCILAAISIFRFFQKLHYDEQALKAATVAEQQRRASRLAQKDVGDSNEGAASTRRRLSRLISNIDVDSSFSEAVRDTKGKLFRKKHAEFVLPQLSFQVSERATKDHLMELGMPLNVVSTREFRNALTAAGALLPGFIAFFGNCLRSNPQITGTATSAWKREYAAGASHEVYAVDTSPLAFAGENFEGMTFADAGRYLRQQSSGCVLLGVGVDNPSNTHGQQSQVILNPGCLVLQDAQNLQRLYVLGTSKTAVDAALEALPRYHRRATSSREPSMRFQDKSRQSPFLQDGANREGHPTVFTPISPKDEVPILVSSLSEAMESPTLELDIPTKKTATVIGKGVAKVKPDFKRTLNHMHSDLPWFVDPNASFVRRITLASTEDSQNVEVDSEAQRNGGIGSGRVENAAAIVLQHLKDTSTAVAALKQAVQAQVATAGASDDVRGNTFDGLSVSSSPPSSKLHGGGLASASAGSAGLVASAEAMLAAATAAVSALPHRPPQEAPGDAWGQRRGRSIDSGGFSSPWLGSHAGGQADFDGHIVIDACHASLRSIMAVLVTIRRLTDLDVVIVMSSTAAEQHERVRQRLRSLHESKYGVISGRAIAQNVYLVTAHKDLNKDALLEARVSAAVSLIMMRGGNAETEMWQRGEADNHMMVKASAVCHALLQHHAVSEKSPSVESSFEDGQSIDTGAPSTFGHAPQVDLHKSTRQSVSSLQCFKRRSSSSGDGSAEHFDLHVVHQMYSDQTIAFLSQSTEVPNFRKAKLAPPVSKFALAASQLYNRERSSSPKSSSDSVPGALPLEASESAGEGSMSGSDVDFGDDDDDSNDPVAEATGGLNGKRMDRLRSDALFNYPVFAAGRVYTDSLMELLMAQAYFNPTEISFWEALLGIEDFDKEHRYGTEIGRRQSIPSKGYDSSSSNFDHSLAELVSFSTKPLQLAEIQLAKNLIGKTYSYLLEYLATHGSSVALGLYRPSGTKGSSMPYMCTNPDPATVLVVGDRVVTLRCNLDYRV